MRGLLLVLAASVPVAAEEKTWDMRALVEWGVAGSAPGIGFTPDGGPAPDVEDDAVQPGALVEFIRATVEPGSWEGEFWIETDQDLIRARHNAATLQTVGTLLEYVTALAGRTVRLEADFLEVCPELAATAAPGLLSAEAARSIASAPAERARRIDRVVLRAAAGRRAHASRLGNRTWLFDHDLEVAKSAIVADPQVGVFREGAVLDALSLVLSDGSTLLVRASFVSARLREMKSFRLAETSGERVDLPRTDVFQARTAVAIPSGRAAVLAATTWKCEKPGWTAVLVLRATLEGGPSAELSARLAREGFSAFDAAAICRGIGGAHEGPRLGLADPVPADGPRMEFVEEDPTVPLDQIADMIRQGAGQEAWEQEGRAMAAMGTQLFVRAPAELSSRVAPVLSGLEALLGANLACESWLVAMDPAAWRDRREPLQRAGGIPEEIFEETLEMARRGASARFEAVSGSLGRTRLRFHVARGSRSWYVEDYDVEIAEGVRGWDPVQGSVSDGLLLELKAFATESGRLLPDLRGTLAEASFGEPEDLGAQGGSPLEPVACAQLSLGSVAPATEGRPFLAATGVRERDGKQEVLLHLVRYRLVR